MSLLTNQYGNGLKEKYLFLLFFALFFVPLRHNFIRTMDSIKKKFAQKLMDIKAIKLQPNEPFTWASGWKSPI